jgi:hypothetical protein
MRGTGRRAYAASCKTDCCRRGPQRRPLSCISVRHLMRLRRPSAEMQDTRGVSIEEAALKMETRRGELGMASSGDQTLGKSTNDRRISPRQPSGVDAIIDRYARTWPGKKAACHQCLLQVQGPYPNEDRPVPHMLQLPIKVRNRVFLRGLPPLLAPLTILHGPSVTNGKAVPVSSASKVLNPDQVDLIKTTMITLFPSPPFWSPEGGPDEGTVGHRGQGTVPTNCLTKKHQLPYPPPIPSTKADVPAKSTVIKPDSQMRNVTSTIVLVPLQSPQREKNLRCQL